MTDDERLSLALPVQFENRLRYLLARMEFSLEEGDLVTNAEGRILCFASSEDALAFGARRFPESEPDTPELRELATLRRGMEAMYAPAVTLYRLDAAAEWAREPCRAQPDPSVLLETWRLLAWCRVAPEPARFDPMGFAGMQWSRPTDEAGRAEYELIETGMKLDGMVRDRERRANRGEPPSEVWPEHEEMWSPADAVRLAGVLTYGLTAFAARLVDNSPS